MVYLFTLTFTRNGNKVDFSMRSQCLEANGRGCDVILMSFSVFFFFLSLYLPFLFGE